MTKNKLECSSKGDKRFSALYAKVTFYGVYDTIENHYQLAKRFGDGKPKTWKDAKGKKPTHLCINNRWNIDIKYSRGFYDLLWVKYFEENPDLAQYVSNFDEFSDMFKSKDAFVCQADSIEKYVKYGKKYIMKEHKELVDLLRAYKKFTK